MKNEYAQSLVKKILDSVNNYENKGYEVYKNQELIGFYETKEEALASLEKTVKIFLKSLGSSNKGYWIKPFLTKEIDITKSDNTGMFKYTILEKGSCDFIVIDLGKKEAYQNAVKKLAVSISDSQDENDLEY